MTRKELDEIRAEKRFWKRYEKPFGWRLTSWTHKGTASFQRLTDKSTVFVGGYGHIRNEELDLIIALDNTAKKR